MVQSLAFLCLFSPHVTTVEEYIKKFRFCPEFQTKKDFSHVICALNPDLIKRRKVIGCVIRENEKWLACWKNRDHFFFPPDKL